MSPDRLGEVVRLLLELVPGGAKKDLYAQQARALLATVRPRDVVGKTRRWLASELIHELAVLDKKIKVAKKELTELVAATGSRLLELHGEALRAPNGGCPTSSTGRCSPTRNDWAREDTRGRL